MASNLPNSWALKNIFIAGIVYGLYLTLSSWVLFYVATHTSFFKDKIHMHDLRFAPRSYLDEFCLNTEIPRSTPVSCARDVRTRHCCIPGMVLALSMQYQVVDADSLGWRSMSRTQLRRGQ